MPTEDLKVSELETQLEDARTNLKDLNQEIRKIVGRPLDNDRLDHKRTAESRRFTEGGPQVKRRLNDPSKSVFSRLSGSTYKCEDESKPRLFSRVYKEQPSREDIVAAQGNDEESKARNRRIFGSLLGTLQKFCQEESKLKSKAEKKAEIEKKLDEKQRREKELLRKEKQHLICERRKQQLKIRLLEIKMIKLRELAHWEIGKIPLANFIRTKSTPHLYFLPKELTQKVEERLRKSKEEVNKLITKQRKQTSKEIDALEAQYAIELKAAETSSDLVSRETNSLEESYVQASDTEVSLIEHNVEPIAFESDGELTGRQEYIENIATNFESVQYVHKNIPASMMIKKEKMDEDDTPSTDGQ